MLVPSNMMEEHMKKLILAILVLLTAASLYALDSKPPFEPEKGMKMPNPEGRPHERKDMPEPVSLSQGEAKASFTKFLSEKLKGFTLLETATIVMPFGNMHQAVVKDASGNRFYLNIMPDGNVSPELMLVQ